jgi:site-specific DNA-methyltransferase (adenine-specific)
MENKKVSDVWTDIHRIRHSAKRDEHPCQLPVHLLDRLILMTTDEGGIVLDPFMGTGTTAISAKRLGRNYIGFELDKKYVEIAQKKLERVEANFRLGERWVSFYLNDIVTMRNNDWDYLQQFFYVPPTARAVDYTKAELLNKKAIPEYNEEMLPEYKMTMSVQQYILSAFSPV